MNCKTLVGPIFFGKVEKGNNHEIINHLRKSQPMDKEHNWVPQMGLVSEN